ncbi:MAG: hypothetical protein KAR30_01540, partial [Gammaproteobacteria bacterium]|nr:hypothetical protein [Gammaproteobacteria bacterium]
MKKRNNIILSSFYTRTMIHSVLGFFILFANAFVPVHASVPTQINNTGSIVTGAGGTDTITSDELSFTAGLQPATSINYTVTTVPVNGQLELTTAPGVAITSFTQEDIGVDIPSNYLVYVHGGGTSTTDVFTFTVDDGQGNTTTSQSFSIDIDTDGDGLLSSNDSDDDGDGMPDTFEATYGFNSLDPDDALLDADNDTYDNLSEFRAGTNPTNPAVNPGTVSNLHYKILAGDGASGDQFGYSVSISGNWALVGAHNRDDVSTNSGSAYVYWRDAQGNWIQQAKLMASDAEAGDEFGYSVSISGDRALVGAYRDDENGTDTGSAYVYWRDAQGNWIQQAKLMASDADGGDWFGYSVSISGDAALVGAYRDGDNGSNSGSAYVYWRNTLGNWVQQTKLLASDGAVGDQFGYSVSISSDRVLVGAYRDDGEAGSNIGSAYVYGRDTQDSWIEQTKLMASDAQS